MDYLKPPKKQRKEKREHKKQMKKVMDDLQDISEVRESNHSESPREESEYSYKKPTQPSAKKTPTAKRTRPADYGSEDGQSNYGESIYSPDKSGNSFYSA